MGKTKEKTIFTWLEKNKHADLNFFQLLVLSFFPIREDIYMNNHQIDKNTHNVITFSVAT